MLVAVGCSDRVICLGSLPCSVCTLASGKIGFQEFKPVPRPAEFAVKTVSGFRFVSHLNKRFVCVRGFRG